MQATRHTHQYYEEILSEHRDLLATARRVAQALTARRGGKSSLPTILVELSTHLSSHFAFESEGGYLHEALESASHLQGQADALEAQHPLLLAAVMDLRQQVDLGTESDVWWEQIEQGFAAFNQLLLEHERAENMLVQEALGRDTGAQD